MIRKIKLLICALLVSCSYANAQDCDISVRVLSPEESGLTKSAGDMLSRRIEQLSNSANFVIGSGSSIAIVPKLTYLTKDVLPGPPTKYSLDFELSLYLIDVNTGAIFYSETMSLKGVDNSESKAQISAIKQIKPTSPQITSMFVKGKQKVIAYYDENGGKIIAEAKRLCQMREYEKALYTILAIPDCSKYAEEATAEAIKIYDRYMDEICYENLQAAKAAWVAEQNESGAKKAAQYLSMIYQGYGCYPDAEKLYAEIKAEIKSDKEFDKSLILSEIEIENNKINAMRDIGVAYGQGQQPNTTNVFGY